MPQVDVKAIVHGAIARTFNFPLDKITDLTSVVDVSNWDSISNAHLVLNLEDDVGVTLPIELIVAAKNVGEIVAIIESSTMDRTDD